MHLHAQARLLFWQNLLSSSIVLCFQLSMKHYTLGNLLLHVLPSLPPWLITTSCHVVVHEMSFSRSLCRRYSSFNHHLFYSPRPSDKVMVTARHKCLLFPPPRYLPSFLSRLGLSIPIFLSSLCSSICIEFRLDSRSLTRFRPVDFYESLARFKPATSTSIVALLTVGPLDHRRRRSL